MMRFYMKTFDTSAGLWLRRVVGPNLFGLVTQLAVSLPLLVLVGGTHSLLLAIAVSAVSAAISLGTFVLVGVRGEHRRALLDTVRQALGRAPQEVPA